MKDVQSQKDPRNIALRKVGVNKLKWPVSVMDPNHGHQNTVATMELSVDLPHDVRGTHMSRFVETVNDLNKLSPKDLEIMLETLRNKLEAQTAHAKVSFDYFVRKAAPVSGIISPFDVQVVFDAEKSENDFKFLLTVSIPTTTLCPCSKEISQYGAHNQRAAIEITIEMTKLVWIEDMVKIAEEASSSPVFSLLKRPDEKWVTETAYENPRFVEDVVREAAIRLEEFDGVKWYSVYAETIESIHNHNAFAFTEKGCTL
jgi:GTP cyclohydrolase IB